MSGVVIDIATGLEIGNPEASEHANHTGKKSKQLMEISAPDGRRVFSISRLLDESIDDSYTEDSAA